MKLLLPLLAVLPAAVSAQTFVSPEQQRAVSGFAAQARAVAQQAQQDNAVSELVEERVCVVVVRMKKQEFTFDLDKQLKNWASAVERTMVVSDTTCEKWKEGQELSGKFDTWGFVFDGDFARYVVRVKSKKIVSRYFETRGGNRTAEIQPAQYQASLDSLRKSGAPIVTVPYSGFIRTTVLPAPVKDLKIISSTPITRNFVLVRIQNHSLTLDLEKHVRNAWNTHDLTFEVPKAVYDKADKVWDTTLSGWAFVVKGSLSAMSGKILKKWTEPDARFLQVTTQDGKSFVIPAN
jgi:hypothetical protein